jgi:hypothetical protein
MFLKRGNTSSARPKAEGDQEALLYVLSIVIGGVVMALIEALIEAVGGRRLVGEALGFFGVWVAGFPFARRTWAYNVPPSRYWAAAITGTVAGAALRVLIH